MSNQPIALRCNSYFYHWLSFPAKIFPGLDKIGFNLWECVWIRMSSITCGGWRENWEWLLLAAEDESHSLDQKESWVGGSCKYESGFCCLEATMMSEDLSNVEEIPSPVDPKASCQGSLLIVGSAHCARKFNCCWTLRIFYSSLFFRKMFRNARYIYIYISSNEYVLLAWFLKIY